MPLKGELAACLGAETRARLLESIVDAFDAFVFIVDLAEERFVFVNERTTEFLGTPAGAVLEAEPERLRDLIGGDTLRRLHESAFAQGQQVAVATVGGRPARYRPCGFDAEGRCTHAIGIVPLQPASFLGECPLSGAEALDLAPTMIWITNQESMCEYLNNAWYAFTGLERGMALGTAWVEAVHPDDVPMLQALSMEAMARNQEVRFEYRLRHASGEYREVLCHAVPRNRHQFQGFMGYVYDLSDQRKERDALTQFALLAAVERDELLHANQRLGELATRDGLTGLLNHRAFQDELAMRIETARHLDRPLALLMLDLDHFKAFNDRYGHPAGDARLQQVARALEGAVDPVDVVARYGGEEFSVILLGASEIDALDVCKRIRDRLAEIPGPAVTASVGVAVLNPRDDRATLICRADAALYQAKGGGRNQFAVA